MELSRRGIALATAALHAAAVNRASRAGGGIDAIRGKERAAAPRRTAQASNTPRPSANKA